MNKLLLIAGPSGVGKTTISDYLSHTYGVPRVVTHTTRPMRANEVAGESYYFETDDSFSKLHLFESVIYDGYRYGSSKEGLDRAFAKSQIVQIIVDTAGVKAYLQQLGQLCQFIYVTVSDLTILKSRLLKRNDDLAEIEKRLSSPELKRDLKLPAELAPYATVVVNDEWEDTKLQLAKIVENLQK